MPAPNVAYSFLNIISYHFNDDQPASKLAVAAAAAAATAAICTDHDHELLKPQLISTWMPNGVGSLPGRRVIFAETQVSQPIILQSNSISRVYVIYYMPSNTARNSTQFERNRNTVNHIPTQYGLFFLHVLYEENGWKIK